VCVYLIVYKSTVCAEPCREALFVILSVERTVCVLHSVERHCVCTAHSKVLLCVYCTL